MPYAYCPIKCGRIIGEEQVPSDSSCGTTENATDQNIGRRKEELNESQIARLRRSSNNELSHRPGANNTHSNDRVRGPETLNRGSAIYYKGDKFCDFLFALLHSRSVFRGVYSKR